MVTYDISNVTCKTQGCNNLDVTLSVYRRPGNIVMCGVCEKNITQISKTGQIELEY